MNAAAHDHKRCTPQGRALGKSLATMADRGVATLERGGIADTRCASCAFRHGTVPNGCPQTQMDALKCLVEGVKFACHAPADGRHCHGHVAARIYTEDNPLPTEVIDFTLGYNFSKPDE